MADKKVKNIKDIKSKYTQFIEEIDAWKEEGKEVKEIRELLSKKYPDFIAENIMKRYRKFKRQIKRGQLEA